MTMEGISAVPREARGFQGRPAGLVTRAIAAFVDAVVVAIALLAGYLGVNGFLFLLDPRGFQFTEASPLPIVTTALLVVFVYLFAAWAITGRSYGCHLMGLRVVGRRGRRPAWYIALLRALFYTLFPIGLVLCAGGRNHRSLQDLVLRTTVIYDWQPRHLD
jgi:uncharacterized RDD family membrane protein YckC